MRSDHRSPVQFVKHNVELNFTMKKLSQPFDSQQPRSTMCVDPGNHTPPLSVQHDPQLIRNPQLGNPLETDSMITAGSIPKWIREIQTKKQQQEQAAKETASSLQSMQIEPKEEQQPLVRSKPRRKVVIEESDSESEEEVIVRKKKSSKSKSKASTKAKLKKKQESSSEDEDLMEEEEVEVEPSKYKNLSKYLRK